LPGTSGAPLGEEKSMTLPFSRTFGSCIAAFAGVLLATTAFGQEVRARLEGIVREGSKPVVGALAVADNYESVWQMKTDAAGGFSFYVPSGCYDVLLSSRFFHPSVKRVCVHAGEVKKLSIKVKREAVPRLPMS
jgi:hypothetical protein